MRRKKKSYFMLLRLKMAVIVFTGNLSVAIASLFRKPTARQKFEWLTLHMVAKWSFWAARHAPEEFKRFWQIDGDINQVTTVNLKRVFEDADLYGVFVSNESDPKESSQGSRCARTAFQSEK